jgi:hypothetical protein
VADLVAEMPEERAVGLGHFAAMTFPLGVVGLGDVDGDQPQSMARNDLRAFLEHRARAGEEVEGEPFFGVLELARQRQAEAQQPVDEAVLGLFQALPEQEILGRLEVGNRAVEPAGAAECVRAVGGHQPVAGAVDRIGAEAESFIGGGQRTPAVAAFGRQGAHHRSIGQIAQNVSAALAPGVLEVEQLAAVLAFEQLHGVAPPAHARNVAILSRSSAFPCLAKRHGAVFAAFWHARLDREKRWFRLPATGPPSIAPPSPCAAVRHGQCAVSSGLPLLAGLARTPLAAGPRRAMGRDLLTPP